ncbi:MAG: hypothetical protein O2963_00145 [Proteobacteria bacterium]|nr:hypothetical protein [Pseudomonadota bacterium]
MADTVSSNVLFNGTHRYSIHLTNDSDGTGESAVTKVDLTNLAVKSGATPAYVVIEKIEYQVNGFNNVRLYWDRLPEDIPIVVLAGQGELNYEDQGGLHDPKGREDGTGDIVLTTDGPTAGDSYDIILHLRLKP